jgi:hypothetical protein
MPYNDWVVAAIVALTPILTNIIVYFVQLYSAKIPAWVKQVITFALSTLVTYIAGLTSTNPEIAALLAFFAVAVHAIINELSKASGLKAKFFGKH